ncbi:phosphomannomutase/phosphoglucomutase [Clostridium sp. OS1-26]|uniref:phosphomannomutase/phosphoglucomutase n=1 Tax=Clostridium sp. OS1-26 TaxID=3070681 RepID=UPI0027E01ADF|nr:phosphomannomutase/phosphoglucomutase [Clostridium sp. OS1-26]WML34835.1 phosphomannomutase/phosphoglucomutase [Clostridium sp. OS1-26]
MSGIFKAYDIRGIYNKEFSRDDVYRIGYFIPRLLKADKVLVGRDCRVSSDKVFEYLSKGITDSGADVYNIGLSTTPMVYFATARHGFDASIQITASHNPKEYNGLKISRTGALPVGIDSGLAELESMVRNNKIEVAGKKGKVVDFKIREEYINFQRIHMLDLSSLSIAVDCSNGMTSLIIRDILGTSPHYIFDTLDGTFPNHEPNPLDEKNVVDLQRAVVENKCDAGVIYDGDGDRVVFVDEKGRFIPPDIMIAVIGMYYLEREKGNVLYDIRTSKAVSECITKLGGEPHMWKVGHAFAKVKLREIKGIFGGELAGHYYFRDFFNCDSGIFASLISLNVISRVKKEGRLFSELIDSIRKYPNSGEINFRIEQKDEAMERLKNELTQKEIAVAFYDFDGYRIEFKDWWFNVRMSNTEPYLRLVVEANSEDLLEKKLSKLKSILGEFK